MLFIVPDASPPKEETSSATPPSDEKKSAIKVELDLDDAPFLDDDNEDQETASLEEEKKDGTDVADTEPAAEEKSHKLTMKALKNRLGNKKLRMLIGAGAIFIVGAILALFLLGSGKEETETSLATSSADKKQKAIIIQLNSTGKDVPATLPGGYIHLIYWKPFLVPLQGAEGEIRLLSCTITIPTNDDAIASELQAKNRILRDAVYYYLSRRPVSFLTTKNAQEDFIDDLVSVINERMSSGKIKTILLHDYLVSSP